MFHREARQTFLLDNENKIVPRSKMNHHPRDGRKSLDVQNFKMKRK